VFTGSLLAILLAACITTWIVRLLVGSPPAGIDDADIFLVYARNISSGHGFVFNAGGERVEGFTSLLWVLICAAASSVLQHPEHALLAVSVLLVSLTAVGCVRSPVCRSHARSTSKLWPYVFIVLLFSDFRYVAWNTITLMEGALWSCLLTASALLTIADDSSPARSSWVLAAVTVLLIFTRPEALVWVPVVILLFYLKCAATETRATAVRLVMPALLAYPLTVGTLTVARLAYFGFPLPNTFYAKVSPSLAFNLREGSRYLMAYVFSGPVPILIVLAMFLSAAHIARVRLRDRQALPLTVLAGVGLIVPVLVGGDHFGGFRFYQGVYPILLLVLVNCLRFIAPQYLSLPGRPGLRRALVLGGGSLFACGFVIVQALEWTDFDERTRLRVEFQIAEAGRARGWDAGRLFADLPARPGIGTITVGGLKYGYPGPVVDLMGLNDTRIAHNGGSRFGVNGHAAFEKVMFYELRPAILIPLMQGGNDLPSLERRDSFADDVLKGLLDDPTFRARYELAEVRRTTPAGEIALAGWYEKGFLSTLAGLKTFAIVTSRHVR
jgi:arabinofuranosyltransferase